MGQGNIRDSGVQQLHEGCKCDCDGDEPRIDRPLLGCKSRYGDGLGRHGIAACFTFDWSRDRAVANKNSRGGLSWRLCSSAQGRVAIQPPPPEYRVAMIKCLT